MREVPGSIPRQRPHHTKDVITMVPLVKNGKYWVFLMNSDRAKIYWIKSGIEILRSRRSLAVVAEMKQPNDHAEPTIVER